jgi:hypothetical protein
MLEFVRGKVSERKLRLFACAYARGLWPQLDDERSRHAVEVAEQYADGVAHEQDRERAWRGAEDVVLNAVANQDFLRATVVVYAQRCLAKSQAEVVRLDFHFHAWTLADLNLVKDIFGNPFRPAPLQAAWLTPTVAALAHTIYDERAFDRLPILADALEEAGCEDEDLLTHCRRELVHARGCWVLDALTGRE